MIGKHTMTTEEVSAAIGEILEERRGPQMTRITDPCDPRYIGIQHLISMNGGYPFCHGCGAVIEGGDTRCPYCERRVGPA